MRRASSKARLPLKVEDLLMVGWVAIVSPVLFRVTGDKGPFDPNQPLEGVLRLASVLGVLVCVAARRPPAIDDAKQPSILSGAAVGPFVGGLLLVAIGGFIALDASSQAVLAVLMVALIVSVAVRLAVPPLSTSIRRVLVGPFVIVAAGLYWSLVAGVSSGRGLMITPTQAPHDPRTTGLILGFLVAFSAVYYTMLIYAPRQIAEREGGAIEWLVRYAAFAVSILLGIGWLSMLTA